MQERLILSCHLEQIYSDPRASLFFFSCEQIAMMNAPCDSHHGVVDYTEHDVASIQEPNVVAIGGCHYYNSFQK